MEEVPEDVGTLLSPVAGLSLCPGPPSPTGGGEGIPDNDVVPLLESKRADRWLNRYEIRSVESRTQLT